MGGRDVAVDAADILRAFFMAPEHFPLGGGLTVHVVRRAEAIGPGRDLAGCLLVERPDGMMRHMTGAELVAFAERNPWIKGWRLDDDE